MSMEQMFPVILLLGLLGVAVASDLRRHRIPNLLVVLGLVLGLAGQAYAGGISGLGDGALGMLIGFGVFLPLYALGGMAAGDVKLMAMVGSFLAPHPALWTAFFSLIAGGLCGLLMVMVRGQVMQTLGRYYVQYFNCTYKRTGILWEGRYRATMLDSEQYLLTCMRYIELNPVRAGMVGHPVSYPWSSFAANAQGETDALLTHHELYCRLGRSSGERQEQYRKLFRAQIPKADVEAIRDSTNKAWVLGNDRFRQRIEDLCGRRSAPLPKGRPTKAPQVHNRGDGQTPGVSRV